MADLSQFIKKPQAAPQSKGFFGNLYDFGTSLASQASGELYKGGGNLIKMIGQGADAINPLTYLAKAMGVKGPGWGEATGNYIGNAANQIGTNVENLRTKTGSTGEAIGSTLGGIAGNVASQIPALVGGEELIGGLNTATKALSGGEKVLSGLSKGVLKSGAQTTTLVGANEGKMPSWKQYAGYGALDAAMFGLGKFGSKLYQSAFTGTSTEAKKYFTQFQETIGQTAEKLGYTGSAAGISKTAKGELPSVWQKLVDTANNGGLVQPSDFEKVKINLLSDYKNLPDSDNKKAIVKEISDIVDSHTPTRAIRGDQVASTISEINEGLFKGQPTVLGEVKLNSIERKLTSGLKDLLPPEVRPIYKEYQIKKVIGKVMADEHVRQVLAKSTLGGTIGAGAALGTGIANGQDAWSIFKEALVSGLIGIAGGNLLGTTAGRTYGGQFLKGFAKHGKLPVKELTESIIKNITDSSGPSAGQSPAGQGRPDLSQFLKSSSQ